MNNNPRQISNISTFSLCNGEEISGEFSNLEQNTIIPDIITTAEGGGGCFPFERKRKIGGKPRFTDNIDRQLVGDKYKADSGNENLPDFGTTFPQKEQIPLLPLSIFSLRKQMLAEIQSKLNVFYELKDNKLRTEFEKFTQTKAPSRFLLIVVLLFTFFFFPVGVYIFSKESIVPNPHNHLFRASVSFVAMISSGIATFSGWKVYSYRYQFFKGVANMFKKVFLGVQVPQEIEDEELAERHFLENETIESTIPISLLSSKKQLVSNNWPSMWKHLRSIFLGPLLPESLPYVTHLFVVSMQIFFCTVFVRRVFSLNCDGGDSMRIAIIYGSGVCYEGDVKMQMMSFNALLLMLYPFLFFVSITEVSIRVIWSMFFISIAVFCISAIILNLSESFPLIIAWISIGFLVVRDHQLRNVLVFLSHKKLEELVSENQRINELNHANEMRHLISNVAHDLKTPLASFTTGIDLIQYTLDDFETKIQLEGTPPKSSSPISSEATLAKQHLIPTIQTCVESIRNTNSFMLMTINRCIDYSKASKGLELVPMEETVDLAEVIQMPLICMRNIQSRIPVHLDTFSSDIHPHIITDKQWLQENLLCLLSNAVKYSSSGEVELSVTLNGSDRNPSINQIDLSAGEDSQDSSHGGDYSGQFQRAKSKSFKRDKSNNKIHPSISEDETVPPMLQMPSITGGGLVDSQTSQPSSPSNYSKGQGRKNMVAKIKHIQHRKRSKPANIKFANTSILFEVADHGIGMSEEDMNVLFSPWNQTQRLAGGTGLGLYSLAKRIEAIGGKYGVCKRRDLQQGSIFWFTIPYRPECVEEERSVDNATLTSPLATVRTEVQPQPQPQPQPALSEEAKENHPKDVAVTPRNIAKLSIPHSPTNSASNCKSTPSTKSHPSVYLTYENTLHLDILIVDDSPAILKMTSMMLKKLGHKVNTAEHGLIALELINTRWKTHRETFDLILMDLQMPVMDGLEATRAIRALEQSRDADDALPKQVIIAVSANSDHEAIKAAYEAGANIFMGKPFDITTFYEMFRNTVLPADVAAGPTPSVSQSNG